ncbi:MAG: CBS domain-containing protein [SAR324 cluster bacterium]|uniref:CBS domain-containing protein n=1 Tax=SAR324 cluster bacterium TaxID=2024889 RepID=A0A7X9FS60_9DELT|nr:CBS domain-containing protein [SAR324 cluster bacterium]
MPYLQNVCVKPNDLLKDVLERLSRNSHGLCVVVDDNNQVLGTITDGDCRRALIKGLTLVSEASQVMNTHFIAVDESFSIEQIMLIMKSNSVDQVPIVDGNRCFLDLVSTRAIQQSRSERKNPVLILAGGQGLRLRPLTSNLPKPMLRVRGRPILERLIERLTADCFRDIYISVNYLGHKIESFFGDGSKWNASIKYLREERELGTAGPLRMLEGKVDSAVLVVNGDLVTTVDFEACVDFHNKGKYDLTLGMSYHTIQIPYGVVQLDQKGKVVSVEEKPKRTYSINAGLYLIEPKLISLIPENVTFPMTGLIESAIVGGYNVGAFPIHEIWDDIGMPDHYVAAQELQID